MDTPTPDIPQGLNRDRAAVAWFGLGALAGAAITVGALALSGAFQPAAAPAFSLNDIREAARAGAQEALVAANDGALESEAIGPANPAAPGTGTSRLVQARPANALGAEGAKVTIIEYSDFQCPYCLRFNQEVRPRIVDAYVKTGKVRLAFKQMPILSEDSRIAALASECAADQGKFWEFHDTVFTERAAKGRLTMDKNRSVEVATTLKMDTDKFRDCMQNDRTLARVQADLDEGRTVGVRGTPTFLINGKLFVGAQPWEAFQQEIEALLRQ